METQSAERPTITTENALVLAGGGVAGIAWETGFLRGLSDEAPGLVERLLGPETTLIGTSAGSTVAAQLATGLDVAELFDRQVAAESAELAATIDLQLLGGIMAEALTGASSPDESRRRLGVVARETETPAPAVRRAVIEARLPRREWPERPLLIPAVDAVTGEFVVFDRSSGADLVDVVAASCAVPGVWPPVALGDRLFMDGGTRTVANADLAAGAGRVLVLVPSAEVSPLGRAVPDHQLEALEPASVLVVCADEASQEALGANPLDPATRIPAARAGREQGRRLAAEIDAFWS
jgi:NTE family protein